MRGVGVGVGMSCGKDPASGVQDKSVCVCVCKQEKSVHCSLQSFLAQMFLQDSKSRKMGTKLDQQTLN